MALSLTVFLALYGIAVVVFLILSFFLLYHAVRFGQFAPVNLLLMIVYSAGAAFLVLSAVQYINAHDWTQTVDAYEFVSSLFY